jgi:hypothetical protein
MDQCVSGGRQSCHTPDSGMERKKYAMCNGRARVTACRAYTCSSKSFACASSGSCYLRVLQVGNGEVLYPRQGVLCSGNLRRAPISGLKSPTRLNHCVPPSKCGIHDHLIETCCHCPHEAGGQNTGGPIPGPAIDGGTGVIIAFCRN